ncbi:hypothetical protein ATR1_143c0001, partial [Acetobacter tropicalis]
MLYRRHVFGASLKPEFSFFRKAVRPDAGTDKSLSSLFF